jgi:hypothetical protein
VAHKGNFTNKVALFCLYLIRQLACCVLCLIMFGVLLIVSLCQCILLGILCRLGMCVILANILEQCSLFLPLQWGAGSMALMLWLDW